MYEGMKHRIEHMIVNDKELKQCSCCLQLLGLEHFGVDNRQWDKKKLICKECRKKLGY